MSGQTPANWTGAARFAEHVARAQMQDIPAAAVAAVRAFTLDTVGVGIGGATSRYAGAVRAAVLADYAPGSDDPVRAWGDGLGLNRSLAAYVNAFQAHAQEFDCVHEGAVLHPFTVVAPVLLAEAAAAGMRGETYVTACAVGVDVAAGLGVAAKSQIRFFRPATCGLFGATAALARARGLDSETTINAFGYALAFASGTMQAHVEGTPALAVQVANAARNAFQAVALAQAGLPGPRGAIDGPFGYLTLFEAETDLAPVLADLGRVWRAAQVSWKPYPTGRAAHGGIDLVRTLRGEGLSAETLGSLVFHVTPLIGHLVGRPIKAPLEVNYARLCLPYAAAVALKRGAVGLDDFTATALQDEEVHALAARISVVVEPNPDQAAFVPQRAVATLNDGRVLEARIDVLPGTTARPLSREEQLAKFRACCAFGFGGARPEIEDALIACIDDLENAADVGRIGRLAAGVEG